MGQYTNFDAYVRKTVVGKKQMITNSTYVDRIPPNG